MCFFGGYAAFSSFRILFSTQLIGNNPKLTGPSAWPSSFPVSLTNRQAKDTKSPSEEEEEEEMLLGLRLSLKH